MSESYFLYVALGREHQWMIINLLKYIHHEKYEMILSKENAINTQKRLCDQLFTLCIAYYVLNGFLCDYNHSLSISLYTFIIIPTGMFVYHVVHPSEFYQSS